jgi:SAM-dependent methyltransferase
MSFDRTPPAWRLPAGVNSALWQYTQTPRLAEEEDDYFRDHPLFAADSEIVDARFTVPGPLVDLGCGAGRHALAFARRGFPVVAVDLSEAMLAQVAAKARAAGVSARLLCLRAGLCDLGAIRDGSFDYALSMFSTLGMIRGRAARRQALSEANRILRPGGRLALHAHNLFLNFRNPQGRLWLLHQALKMAVGRPDAGDRRMIYRGIPGMEVHLYRWRELRRELRGAGFHIDEVLALDAVRARPIVVPWLLPRLRAGGWIVLARRLDQI